MKLIIIMSTMLSMMFMNMKQPMQMIIIILMQALFTVYMMSVKTKSSWFTYMLLIIFIGGMMVLFIYITSITPNEQNKGNMSTIIMMTILISTITMMMKNMEISNNETMNMNTMNMLKTEQLMLNKMFNMPMYTLTIMMMIYLFIALIAMNKISNMKKGPLRKMN
uniref:NADH-ubiquinone oxidoreductase chain 6 n=1 Tax=Exothotettix guangxiensis TaxID=3068914 RepID=A0AA51UCI2_9ORTH|nr:NADH dehydrogenase subunit 6 [Exothotettix guangxiensis]WMV02060.1 NADH dehydrogenase subunit 6 [Exothotettix guangxiensis]